MDHWWNDTEGETEKLGDITCQSTTLCTSHLVRSTLESSNTQHNSYVRLFSISELNCTH